MSVGAAGGILWLGFGPSPAILCHRMPISPPAAILWPVHV